MAKKRYKKSKKARRRAKKRTARRMTRDMLHGNPVKLWYDFAYDINLGQDPGHDEVYFDLARDCSVSTLKNLKQMKANGTPYVYTVDVMINPQLSGVGEGGGLNLTGEHEFRFYAAPCTWWVKAASRYAAKRRLVMLKQVEGYQRLLHRYNRSIRMYWSDGHRDATIMVDDSETDPKAFATVYGMDYGEWDYTPFTSPDGTTGADEFTLHLYGEHEGTSANVTGVGLLKSYFESRPSPVGWRDMTIGQESSQPFDSNDPLLNLLDHGTVVDEIAADLYDKNDKPPWPTTDAGLENAWDSPRVLAAGNTVTPTGGAGVTYVRGLKVPFGLLNMQLYTKGNFEMTMTVRKIEPMGKC